MWSSFVAKPEQTWLLWQKSKAVRQQPSQLLHIEDPYVAYCLDEAVVYFGLQVEAMLDEAANPKPSKEEKAAERRQRALLDKLFDLKKGKSSGFADPALMFK